MNEEIKNNINRPIWEVDTLYRFIIVNPLSLEGGIIGYSIRRDVKELPPYIYSVNTLDIDSADNWDWSLKGAVDKKINKLHKEVEALQEWEASNAK
jgi:hypothetical protein